MVIDIITYKLSNEISENFLLTSAEDILNSWMKKQPGFLKWHINKNDDNSYTDFVFWNSKEDLEAAASKMSEIPNNHDWLKCYDMSSIQAKKVENLFHS